MKLLSTRTIITAVLSVIIFSSCAVREEESYGEIERKALEKWIESNAPSALPLGDTGVYYEVLEKPEVTGDINVRGKWIDVEYTLRDMNGDIVYTRNEAVARLLGTYDNYTHYVPARLYVAHNPNSSNIPLGMYQALINIPQGEMWRVYIPSEHAFGTYGFKAGNGYAGQKTLGSNVPLIVDSLRISNVIDNPQVEGIEAIKRFVTADAPEGWGKMPGDTIRKNMYIDIYRRGINNDTVAMNSSVYIYYKVKYLDGKLLNSNIDSVLQNSFGTVRTQDLTSPLRLTRMEATPANAYRMPEKIFYAILPELRYGDIARIAVPSEYGYFNRFMPPNKSESEWESSATFTTDTSYDYDNYSTTELDTYFGTATFYVPYTSTIVSIGEISPYAPLIYEFIVQRADE